MKILHIILISQTLYGPFGCTNKPIPSETKITKSTRIISQTEDSLVMSYLKDTFLLAYHENELHNAPVMQFRIENNTSKVVKFLVTPYIWLSSHRNDKVYSNGRKIANYGWGSIDDKFIPIESYSADHFYYPKEDSITQLTLYLKHFSDSNEQTKIKEVVIEIGN